MQENLLNKKNSDLNSAEKYIGRYLKDLQKHFNLSDTQLIKILKNLIYKLKKKNHEKKWWHFF